MFKVIVFLSCIVLSFCFLCFSSAVSFTGSYTQVKPKYCLLRNQIAVVVIIYFQGLNSIAIAEAIEDYIINFNKFGTGFRTLLESGMQLFNISVITDG